MGRVVDFITRLPVANTGFTIPLDEVRGVGEHKKVFHFVLKNSIYEYNKKTLDVTCLCLLEPKGAGNIKKPVDIVVNKNYTIILDNENVYLIDIKTREARHIWWLSADDEEEEEDDE